MLEPDPKPNQEALAGVAAGQGGLFSTSQAEQSGYSRALLAHHVSRGAFTRVGRKVYRFTHFPADEQQELIAIWLATDQKAVFSHETALALHGLSDVLPSRIHVTLPTSWRRRRLGANVVAAFDGVPETDRVWVGAVPVTNVRRTLRDCAASGVQFEFIEAAVNQALDRGLLGDSDIEEVRRELAGPKRSGKALHVADGVQAGAGRGAAEEGDGDR